MSPKARNVFAGLMLCMMLAQFPSVLADALPDWVVLEAVGGPEGATFIVLGIEGHFTSDGSRPVVVGTATAAGATFTHLTPYGGGPLRLSTTRGLLGVDVTIDETDDPFEKTFSVGVVFDLTLDPGESASFLFFATGTAIDELDVLPPRVGGGSVEVSQRIGGGSEAVGFAEPTHDGFGAAAGPVGAGFARHSRVSHRGLVGGMAVPHCTMCSGAWTGPDGVSHTWSTVGGFGEGDSDFAGPSGTWSWQQTGVEASATLLLGDDGSLDPSVPNRLPIYAAYAPIGDDWRLFAD